MKMPNIIEIASDPNFDPRRPKIRSRLTAISSREVSTIVREPRLRVTKAHTTVGLRQAHLARMRCQSRDLVAIFVKIYITIELHQLIFIYLLYTYNDCKYNSHILGAHYCDGLFKLCETAHQVPLFFFTVARLQPRNTQSVTLATKQRVRHRDCD